MQPQRSLRLRNFNSQELDQISYDPGEIFFDSTNSTLRLLTGSGNRGGESVSTRSWTTTYIDTLLSAASAIHITDTTPSTSTLTGSLTTAGGLGVNGRITATDITVTNPINGSITGNAGTVTNGVYTTGSYTNPSWIASLSPDKVLPTQVANRWLASDGTNISWTDPRFYGGSIPNQLTVSNSTASTSTSTGAIVTGGGIGVAGRVTALSVYSTSANITSASITTTTAGTISADGITLTAQGTTPNSLVTKAYIDSKIWLAIAVGY